MPKLITKPNYTSEAGKKRITHMVSLPLRRRITDANIKHGMMSDFEECLWDSFLDLYEKDPDGMCVAAFQKRIRVSIAKES